MSFNPSSPGEGLAQFFDKIWGDVEGLVYIARKYGTVTEPIWKKAFFKWYTPSGRKLLLDTIQTANAQGAEVYFSPAIWSEPKISKQSFKGTNVLWADFDGSAPEWSDGPTAGGAEDGTGAVPGPPTIEVQSSSEGHKHVYWVLNNFNTDVNFVQDTNRAIAYQYGADTSGWDAEQILRPPFTTNHKRGMPVLVARFDDTSYSTLGFTGFKPVVQLVKDNLDLTALPDPVVVIGKYNWDSDTLELLNREDVPEGSRSSAMARIAYYCAERGMTDAEAYTVLFWLDDKWGKFKYRNDRTKRLLDLVNKARQKYPHAVEDPTFAGLQAESTTTTVDERLHYNGSEILDLEVHVDWLFDEFVLENGITVIAAPGGIGKTQLTMQMAKSAATGEAFLNFNCHKPTKSAILSLEMGLPPIVSLWKTMGRGWDLSAVRNRLEENVMITALGYEIPLGREDGKKWLSSYVKDNGIQTLFIDSLGKIVKDLNDDAEIRAVFGQLRRLNCTVVVVHHTRKAQEGNKKPKAQADVYGSQYITSEPDGVLGLWVGDDTKKDIIEVSHLKNRMAKATDPFTIRRTEHLNFERAYSEEVIGFNGLQPGSDERPNPGATGTGSNPFT